MKRIVLLALVALVALQGFEVGAQTFPSKPIKVLVYTAPGGLIDITARKMVEIAHKYTDATLVVENKSGAGGLVGWEYVLSQPADGYTPFAVTRSVIANLVGKNTKVTPATLDWIAFLVSDPECLITGTNNKVKTWSDIVADAKARPGKQIWAAPPGIDEYMTKKIWEKAGITGKFVPYDSGNQAMAAVMGGMAAVYVGNPADVAGKPNLSIAVVAGEKRLGQFPGVPTFRECGISGLEMESMWRGFALKKGTPENVIAWYDDLFDKITADPDWRNFFEVNGMELVHIKRNEFNNLVEKDLTGLATYLKKK